MTELDVQISELQSFHRGLKKIEERKREIVLSGLLPFEATADGHSTLTECFEIELMIPTVYPKILPRVRETGGKIDSDYGHFSKDRTLCLAVPIEERRLFLEQPSLLGFVNKLVIPFFYGYCHWKKSGNHPFGEQKHAGAGIIQYYIDRLNLSDEATALAFVRFLHEFGYRGHLDCPCGSGLKVRKCHGPTLRDLHQHHTPFTLRHDLYCVRDHCTRKNENGQSLLPDKLTKQIIRIVDEDKR